MSVGVKNDLRVGEELNHLAVVKLILVISVLEGDFCFFSSLKRKKIALDSAHSRIIKRRSLTFTKYVPFEMTVVI